MYFWDTKELAKELCAENFKAISEFQYLLGVQVITCIALYLALSYQYEISLIFLIEVLLYLCVTILGVFYCYKANDGAQGKDFIKRFICLSFPLSIKVTVVVWAVTYSYAWFIEPGIINYTHQIQSFIYSIIFITGEIWFFWRLSYYYKMINHGFSTEIVK